MSRFRVTLVALPGEPPAAVRLRRALKTLLRVYGLRCRLVETLPEPPAATDVSAGGGGVLDSQGHQDQSLPGLAIESDRPVDEEHFAAGWVVLPVVVDRDPRSVLQPASPQEGEDLSMAGVAVLGLCDRRDADDPFTQPLREESPELAEREAFTPTRRDDDLGVGDPAHGVLEGFQARGLQPVAGRIVASQHTVYIQKQDDHEEDCPSIRRRLLAGAPAAEQAP